MSADRLCNRLACGRPIIRKPREAIVHYKRRIYCSRACADRCSPHRRDFKEARVDDLPREPAKAS